MTAKKEAKAKRECGFCHKSGHNIRSCEERKASEAAGAPAETVHGGASTALALVEASTNSAEALAPGAAHMPIEFEEASKQVHVNGTTLRLMIREFESGLANMTLRFQREATGAKDIQFDQEVGVKLYELVGWALQRLAARQPGLRVSSTSKVNGAGSHAKAEAAAR